MEDFREAIKIVLTEFEGKMKPIGCVESDTCYAFNMIPDNVDPKAGFANGCTYVVDKGTLKHYWMNCVTFCHEHPAQRTISVDEILKIISKEKAS